MLGFVRQTAEGINAALLDLEKVEGSPGQSYLLEGLHTFFIYWHTGLERLEWFVTVDVPRCQLPPPPAPTGAAGGAPSLHALRGSPPAAQLALQTSWGHVWEVVKAMEEIGEEYLSKEAKTAAPSSANAIKPLLSLLEQWVRAARGIFGWPLAGRSDVATAGFDFSPLLSSTVPQTFARAYLEEQIPALLHRSQELSVGRALQLHLHCTLLWIEQEVCGGTDLQEEEDGCSVVAPTSMSDRGDLRWGAPEIPTHIATVLLTGKHKLHHLRAPPRFLAGQLDELKGYFFTLLRESYRIEGAPLLALIPPRLPAAVSQSSSSLYSPSGGAYPSAVVRMVELIFQAMKAYQRTCYLGLREGSGMVGGSSPLCHPHYQFGKETASSSPTANVTAVVKATFPSRLVEALRDTIRRTTEAKEFAERRLLELERAVVGASSKAPNKERPQRPGSQFYTEKPAGVAEPSSEGPKPAPISASAAAGLYHREYHLLVLLRYLVCMFLWLEPYLEEEKEVEEHRKQSSLDVNPASQSLPPPPKEPTVPRAVIPLVNASQGPVSSGPSEPHREIPSFPPLLDMVPKSVLSSTEVGFSDAMSSTSKKKNDKAKGMASLSSIESVSPSPSTQSGFNGKPSGGSSFVPRPPAAAPVSEAFPSAASEKPTPSPPHFPAALTPPPVALPVSEDGQGWLCLTPATTDYMKQTCRTMLKHLYHLQDPSAAASGAPFNRSDLSLSDPLTNLLFMCSSSMSGFISQWLERTEDPNKPSSVFAASTPPTERVPPLDVSIILIHLFSVVRHSRLLGGVSPLARLSGALYYCGVAYQRLLWEVRVLGMHTGGGGGVLVPVSPHHRIGQEISLKLSSVETLDLALTMLHKLADRACAELPWLKGHALALESIGDAFSWVGTGFVETQSTVRDTPPAHGEYASSMKRKGRSSVFLLPIADHPTMPKKSGDSSSACGCQTRLRTQASWAGVQHCIRTVHASAIAVEESCSDEECKNTFGESWPPARRHQWAVNHRQWADAVLTAARFVFFHEAPRNAGRRTAGNHGSGEGRWKIGAPRCDCGASQKNCACLLPWGIWQIPLRELPVSPPPPPPLPSPPPEVKPPQKIVKTERRESASRGKVNLSYIGGSGGSRWQEVTPVKWRLSTDEKVVVVEN